MKNKEIQMNLLKRKRKETLPRNGGLLACAANRLHKSDIEKYNSLFSCNATSPVSQKDNGILVFCCNGKLNKY